MEMALPTLDLGLQTDRELAPRMMHAACTVCPGGIACRSHLQPPAKAAHSLPRGTQTNLLM